MTPQRYQKAIQTHWQAGKYTLREQVAHAVLGLLNAAQIFYKAVYDKNYNRWEVLQELKGVYFYAYTLKNLLPRTVPQPGIVERAEFNIVELSVHVCSMADAWMFGDMPASEVVKAVHEVIRSANYHTDLRGDGPGDFLVILKQDLQDRERHE